MEFENGTRRNSLGTCILYDFRCGLSQQESCHRFQLAFGNEAPDRNTGYSWLGEF